MAPKEELLAIADEARYFGYSPARLDRVWRLSNGFIDQGRFVCSEGEWHALLEQHFFLSVLTCRDTVAKLMLKRLMEQFGEDSRRIYMLRTVFVLATLDSDALQTHLSHITSNEIDALKVGMALHRHDARAYMQALADHLDANPLDAEAWSELAEAYYAAGKYTDAAQCIEQLLVLLPHCAYAFCRLGELQRLARAESGSGEDGLALFARAVELNPVYVRAWCGLLLAARDSDDPRASALAAKGEAKARQLVDAKTGSEADLAAARRVLELVK